VFIEIFNIGPEGFQPHNFVTQNGINLELKAFNLPTFQNYFKWLNGDFIGNLSISQDEIKNVENYTDRYSGSNIDAVFCDFSTKLRQIIRFIL